ncbi:MAG: peptide ABC transporter substrate-binding protein [Planctomycetota bacterium]
MSSRLIAPFALLGAALLAVGWSIREGQLPPADFTFNNGTEVKSFDPAVLIDNASGRIAWALYEGLVRLSPEDRTAMPGMADSWEISDDGRTYTFNLRPGAVWSNGDPVVAQDFVYSMRRFLDPQTQCEYAYQAWYLKNARKYSRAMRGLEPGDPVEVELHTPPKGASPFARGELVYGKLLRVEEDPSATPNELADDDKYTEFRTFVIKPEAAKPETEKPGAEGEEPGDGGEQSAGGELRFRVNADEGATFADARVCKQVLLDFREVGIRAVDERTVETVLQDPTPYWLELLGFYPLSPVNQRCIEEHGPKEWVKPENLVTNGAYRVEFHRLRDRIRLKKNPLYWDAQNVAIETIDAMAVESQETAFKLYETGQIDWCEKTPALIAKELLKADPPRRDLNPAPYLATYFYAFNTDRKPFDDPRVRRALALAIDRQEIISVAGAGEEPALSLSPPGLPGYTAPRCPPADPARARELLAEAGFPGGVGFPKIEILYNNNEGHATVAEMVRKQWRRNLQINVAAGNQEFTTVLKNQREQNYDVTRRGWIGDYMDPNTFLDMFVTGGENNQTGWSNAEYDRLIRGAAKEPDTKKRLDMLRRAEEVLMDELPIMPIYYYVSRNLVRPTVHGFYNNTQDSHPLWALRIEDDASLPNDYFPAAAESPQAEPAAADEAEAAAAQAGAAP